jgi:branched-chain amino acid transport system substrate-binding protein
MTLATGTVLIDRYRIVRLLGQGGFGAVYRVWDLHLNGPFALKENLDASPEATRQFAREAQILANLGHPNLPRVTDHFSLPDQGQYLVMEYVEGEDLEEKRCKSTCQPAGSLPEEQVLTWISQILDALEYLHRQDPPIIHRDIKPANIRITPQGRATLVDFGIAKIFNPILKTTVGARAITPGFSPLEQYGQGATDARSDIYALGATLYVLLTGQTPPESIARAWKDPLQPPEQLNPGLSPSVCLAIDKALKTDPVDRWQNIAELRNALRKPVTSIGERVGLPGPALPQTLPTQDAVLVAPVGSMPATTPMEEFRPPSPAIPKKVTPARATPRKSKSRLPLALAAGAGLLLLVVSAIIGYIFFGPGLQATATPVLVGVPPAPTFSYGAVPPTIPPEPGKPIRIGLLAPLSGPVPTFGVSDSEGAQLAVKEWNEKGGVLGRPVELIVADSQCSAYLAPSVVNMLNIHDGIKYIVGEVCSSASIPVSELTNKNKIVQISPTSTNLAVTGDIGGRTKQFVFRACFIDSFQGLVMAKFAVQRGYKTAFIMSDPGNAYVSGLAESFEKSFIDSGGQIVGKETYTSSQKDFSAILAQVAASRADVLYIPDYYNIVNLVGAQAKNRGLTAVLMGGDGWDSVNLDVKALDGGFYSNHYDPGDTRPIVQDWLKRYGAQYKDNLGKPKVPDAIATLAYDATNMLLAAIQQAGVDDTSQVAQTLARLSWNGVTGTITFDEYHNPIKPVVIITVRNGQKVYFATVNP